MSDTHQIMLGVNSVLYLVLVPSKVVDNQGNPSLAMIGPFSDAGTANMAMNKNPGSFLAVQTIIAQSPPLPPLRAVPN